MLFSYSLVSLLDVAEADGTTPVIIAAAKGNLELLKLLHKHGADLLVKSTDILFGMIRYIISESLL